MSTRPPRRRRVASHAEEEHENAERWLLTYADMITLLMVLFIVLFAVSQIDKKKFAELHEGLSKAFKNDTPVQQGGSGILNGGRTITGHPGLDGSTAGPQLDTPTVGQAAVIGNPLTTDPTLAKVRQQISTALSAKGLQADVAFRSESRGLVVSIVTDRVLFDLGSAVLRPDGARVLDVVAPALRGTAHDLAVEGHTDDIPITGEYADNWALSTARATTVLRRLLGDGIAATRLSAAGYADTHPVAHNDSDAHRARNRRVEIVVLASAAAATTDAALTAGVAK
jgi:chemotaxis protein MotB